MLQNEQRILMHLLDDLTKHPSIREISIELNQKYSQTYQTVKQLETKDLVIIQNLKNNKRIFPNFHNIQLIEIEICRFLKSHKEIHRLQKKLPNYTTILFGSQTRKYKLQSDYDLLIISSEDPRKIEEEIYNNLAIYPIDLQITTEKGLKEMWSKNELNVGNEILKNHVILKGFEHFTGLLANEFEKYHKGTDRN